MTKVKYDLFSFTNLSHQFYVHIDYLKSRKCVSVKG